MTRTRRFASVPEWIVYSGTLDPMDVRVFAVLDRHQPNPHPSAARIASMLQVSESTVRRALERLTEAGAIEVVPRFRGDGGQDSNGYRLAGDHPFTRGTPLPFMGDHPSPSPENMAPWSPVTNEGNQLKDGDTSDEVSPCEPSQIEAFDAFWNGYPRKAGKPAARKAWAARVEKARVDTAEVLAGLARWADYWTAKGEPEFVPYPATWLNRDGWTDLPPPLPRGSHRRGPIPARDHAPRPTERTASEMEYVNGVLRPKGGT